MGSASAALMALISSSSPLMVLGRVSSACFSLKLILRFGAAEVAAVVCARLVLPARCALATGSRAVTPSPRWITMSE
ncbi:hypothetical protein D3C72_2302210 [compost metagenome]